MNLKLFAVNLYELVLTEFKLCVALNGICIMQRGWNSKCYFFMCQFEREVEVVCAKLVLYVVWGLTSSNQKMTDGNPFHDECSTTTHRL